MFRRLIEFIKDALRKMVAYNTLADSIGGDTYIVSDDMSDAMQLWKSMYKDKSPWLNEEDGVFSLGLAQTICNEFSTLILDEIKSKVVEPGQTLFEEDNETLSTRASFLNNTYKNKVLPKLQEQVEKAMAMGGMIIKPYLTSDRQLAFDFIKQGDFIPLSFDEDGNITDIAIIAQFIEGDKIFTKVERQTFLVNQVIVENKAFVADIVKEDDDTRQDLGSEVPLEKIARWSGIEPLVTINNVDKPLYGYYKIPLANTIDLDCPLGVSIFSAATSLIKRCDMQFSRLDWEYEGGQIAIDIDETALRTEPGYYGSTLSQDRLRNRIYRGLDLGTDDTYKEFAPVLRDNSYQNGLSKYLEIVEDKVGLARGTLGEVKQVAKTATEIRASRQKTFVTVHKNQEELEKCLVDVVYAMDVYTSLYELAPEGAYVLNTEWSDSVLIDTETELEQKLNLKREGVLGAAEIRAWYTGEDLETAKSNVEELEEKENQKTLNDIFSGTGGITAPDDDNAQDDINGEGEV